MQHKSFSGIAVLEYKLWLVEVQKHANFYVRICPTFAGPVTYLGGAVCP